MSLNPCENHIHTKIFIIIKNWRKIHRNRENKILSIFAKNISYLNIFILITFYLYFFKNWAFPEEIKFSIKN